MRTKTKAEELREKDPDFVKHLKASEPSRYLVQRMFLHRGWHVWKPVLRIRKKEEDRFYYQDNRDLIIWKPDDGIKYRLEVKQALPFDFTCEDDYPHPAILLEQTNHTARHKELPLFYITVNRKFTHMAAVNRDTKDSWFVKKYKNRINKTEEEGYFCPKELATFFEIPAEVIRIWKETMRDMLPKAEDDFQWIEDLKTRPIDWRKYVKTNQERYKLWSDY